MLPNLRKTFQSHHGHNGGGKDLKLSEFGILPSARNLYVLDFFLSVT